MVDPNEVIVVTKILKEAFPNLTAERLVKLVMDILIAIREANKS